MRTDIDIQQNLIARGANPAYDGPDAVGFATAIRFLHDLPEGKRVFLFVDSGWGDPGARTTRTICPIEGQTGRGDRPLLTLTRAAVWLLREHGFLGPDTYGGHKARRVHDVALRGDRAWWLAHAEAIEEGHAAGVEFSLRDAPKPRPRRRAPPARAESVA